MMEQHGQHGQDKFPFFNVWFLNWNVLLESDTFTVENSKGRKLINICERENLQLGTDDNTVPGRQ